MGYRAERYHELGRVGQPASAALRSITGTADAGVGLQADTRYCVPACSMANHYVSSTL